MVWTPDITRGYEAAKIKYEIVPYTRGKVLDLGSGPFKLYPHFINVDNKKQPQEFEWKPDIEGDASDLARIPNEYFDSVFSAHLLEHLEDTAKVLKEWWRVVAVGGYMVLYLPHKNLYPNVGEPGSNPDHKHDFLPEDIINYMKDLGGWDLLRNEDRNERDEYSFFQVYRKRNDHRQEHEYLRKKPKKTCAVVRYGGIGDCIQASSVLPLLKAQGYHITMHTIPTGQKYLENDPNIDAWYVQDREQVPNSELRNYWNVCQTHYDKWVNLSQSVEDMLLPVYGQAAFHVPHEVRHLICNHNYMEITHRIAQVPLVFNPRFYPNGKEKDWAIKTKKDLGRVMLWVISGSSIHKIWPWMDQFIASVLTGTEDWQIVLVGDEPCRDLIEPAWREQPRVHLRSAVWSVRETMAFAQQADMIVGPETGVLNSVSMMPMPKIIFLSHSSVENLTKHWINTVSLFPSSADCPCYPCHQLHHQSENYWKYCKRDEETGVSLCQAKISLDQAWYAFLDLTRTKGKILWQGDRPLIIQSCLGSRELS